MSERSMKEVCKMEIGDRIIVDGDVIMRVYGGWVYKLFTYTDNETFVNTEFVSIKGMK